MGDKKIGSFASKATSFQWINQENLFVIIAFFPQQLILFIEVEIREGEKGEKGVIISYRIAKDDDLFVIPQVCLAALTAILHWQ